MMRSGLAIGLAATVLALAFTSGACTDLAVHRSPAPSAVGGGGNTASTTATGAGGMTSTGGMGGAGGSGGEGGSEAVCPTHLEFAAIGQNMRADVGWNGVSHRTRFPQGTMFTVETFDCDEDCRRCRVRGPVRNDPVVNPVVSQRCLDDVSIACSNDDECPTGDCRFIYSPMINGDEGLTCLLFYFEPTVDGDYKSSIQGTFDMYTGESQLQVFNMALALTFFGRCEQCQGDTTPFDGSKDGVCAATPGVNCDVSSIANSAASPFNLSYDCPRVESGSPLNWPVRVETPTNHIGTASQVWTMHDDKPFCTAAGHTSDRCWCGECDDTGLPCENNSDCPTGTCNAGDGVPTKPHACPVGDCIWDDATQTGECANGTPCFTNDGEIRVPGDNHVMDGFYISRLAGLQCLPATGIQSTDQIIGLPGIMYSTTPYRVTPRSL
jgi:hypothetical protein